MKDILEKEITGEPATVSIAGSDYPLAYPMFAVVLYKQETAKLDRSRAAGREKLTSQEVRELKERRRKLVADTDEKSVEWPAAVAEAAEIKRRLDEDSCQGDSLFNIETWWKINEDDPERILRAIWCGLHVRQENESWAAPLTLRQLESAIDFSNCHELLVKIHEALSRYMPKGKKEASPNAAAPAEETAGATTSTS